MDFSARKIWFNTQYFAVLFEIPEWPEQFFFNLNVSLYQDLYVFITDKLLLKACFVNLNAPIEKQKKTFEGKGPCVSTIELC